MCGAICCATPKPPHAELRHPPSFDTAWTGVGTDEEQFPMIFDCCSVASSVRPNVSNLCSVIVGSFKPLSRTFDIAHLWMICDFTSLSFSWKLQCFASCCKRVLYWSRVSAAICSACLNLKISYSLLHCGLKYSVRFRFVSAKLRFLLPQLRHSVQTPPRRRNVATLLSFFCHSECFSQQYSSQTDAPNSPSVGLRCQLVQAKTPQCPRQFPFCL